MPSIRKFRGIVAASGLLAATLAGCGDSTTATPDAPKAPAGGGAMDKGPMEGGAMDKGKTDGGMDKGKMDAPAPK